MKTFTGIMALVALLSFGTATIAFSQAPAPTPAPTDDKGKDKKPQAPKVFAGDEKKDEKKGDK